MTQHGKIHLANSDGDNWSTACGWRGLYMSGRLVEVTCKACQNSREFKLAIVEDRRFDFTKVYRNFKPSLFGLPDDA